ncbi:MAG: ABC transporter permease subunit, partial [Rectinema sp.]|nr:ABC transporter permease subunit [Rectinema sp.]
MRSKLSQAAADLRRAARDPVLMAVILLVTGSLIIFVLYPLISVGLASLDTGGGKLGLSVYRDAMRSAYIRKAFYNSLLMSTLTSLVGTFIGFLFAFAVTRARVPLSKFFNTIAVIPIISPPFIGALAIIMLFGNNGLITWNLLRIQNFPIYGFNGLFLAQVVTFFPVAYLTLKGVLESMNPVLEDAAMDLGGTRWKVFRKVTLPLAFPGIAGSVLLLFVETLADFGNPLIL